MTYLRTCGSCADLNPIDAVRCETCGSLLVLTKPVDTSIVGDARFGKRAACASPKGRAA